MLKKVSMLALLCAVTVGSAYSSRGEEEREENSIPKLQFNQFEDSIIFSPDSEYCANEILNNLTEARDIIGFASSLSIQEGSLNALKKKVTTDSLFSFEEEAKYKAIKKLLEAFPEFENSKGRRCTAEDFIEVGQNFGNSGKGANELFKLYRNWKVLGTDLVLKPLEAAYIAKSKELLSDANNRHSELMNPVFAAKNLSTKEVIDFTQNNSFEEVFKKFEDVSNTKSKISEAVSSINDVNSLNSADDLGKAITTFRTEYIKAIDSFDFIKTDYIQYNQWAVNFGKKLVNHLNENPDNRYNRIKNLKSLLQTRKDTHAGLVEFLDNVLNKYLCGQGEVFVKTTKEAQEIIFNKEHKMRLEQENQKKR